MCDQCGCKNPWRGCGEDLRGNPLRDKLDAIDAAVFSSDAFHDLKMLDMLQTYIGRWQREAQSIRNDLERNDDDV